MTREDPSEIPALEAVLGLARFILWVDIAALVAVATVIGVASLAIVSVVR